MKNYDNCKFLCYILEELSRFIHQPKTYILDNVPREAIQDIYELSDIYHSEDSMNTVRDLINKYNPRLGRYFTTSSLFFRTPTIDEIAETITILAQTGYDCDLDGIYDLYYNPVMEVFEDFNTDMYYQPIYFLLRCFKERNIKDEYYDIP